MFVMDCDSIIGPDGTGELLSQINGNKRIKSEL